MTNEEFFKSRTAPQPNGCVLWTGARGGSRNYGLLWRKPLGIRLYAHRFSYAQYVGTIPTGYSVLHKCDNPLCVNPDHLFAGTQADNMKDMAAKGRANAPKGEAHCSRKLDECKVREIRASSASLSALAAQYGVSSQSIHGIRRTKYWKHVQ